MNDQAAPAFGLDPFAPGFHENPYAQYEGLRTQPILRTPMGQWLVPRWEEAHALLRRPNTSVEEEKAVQGRPTRLADLVEGRAYRRSRAILNIDPPDHTRLRRLMSKAFTPRAVEQIRDRTIELTEGLLDGLAGRGEPIDLIGELAFPLPFTVISEMLGMPDGDRDQLRAWSHTLSQALDPIGKLEHAAEILEASDHMNGRIAEVIAWKRGRLDTDDDLLAALIRAEDEGDVLTDTELVENVILLYVAGHETTVNLIGNGVLALLRNRDELRRLVADPTLDGNAVEELLRYDSPVQFSRRVAMEPFEVAGEQIEPGDLIMTALGSANRDETKFGPDAARLDLGRPNAREHLSFGNGVHHCLGAALARLEGQEAIGRLVRRFPDLELAGEPAQNGRIVLRGLDHLPIALGA